MALINCPECLKEVSDNAKACPHCGFPLKKKGKGFAIASLVLGIISCVYSLPPMLATISEPDIPKAAIIAMAVYIMIFGVLSFIFGIVSHCKGCKLKKKTAGLILSTVSIIVLIVVIILTAL